MTLSRKPAQIGQLNLRIFMALPFTTCEAGDSLKSRTPTEMLGWGTPPQGVTPGSSNMKC